MGGEDMKTKHAFIAAHASGHAIRFMCRVLGVAHSWFHARRRAAPKRAERVARRGRLGSEIREIFEQSKRCYGAPRIHAELKARGFRTSKRTVAKLMRENGIRPPRGRRRAPITTDSRHSHAIAPNLLDRNFEAAAPDAVGCCERRERRRSSAAVRPCSNSTTPSSQRRRKLRDQVRNLTRMRRLRTCAAWRPDAVGYRDPVVATKLSLKYLARRILDLNDEIAELDRFIVPLVEELAPSLLELEGVGTENAGAVMVAVGDNPDRLRSEASFAMMCGVCPIPASSGKTQRHRLNRGGNRQANSALHMVVVCRMRTDQRTRAYVARRTQEGLSKREVMRCLKRYVAREIYRVLTAPSSA